MADVAFVSRSCAFSVLDEISKVCNFHGFCCTEPITNKKAHSSSEKRLSSGHEI